ncbi:hypothetical protein MTR67_019196 [Solanum verrucosum]|uniref:Copia protein n=1 Tax=Solanum verrucosum TaxID=315347 RepID=A0AAF0QS74_SOLVR|nr:hypothetical protein MTR67_019196 [Solanum verrucosum]
MVVVVVEVMIGLLKDLYVEVITLIQFFHDRKVAMQITANSIFHERTEYIKIDCYFVREKLKEGLIYPVHVSTKFQLANLLTKGLGVAQHNFLLSKL